MAINRSAEAMTIFAVFMAGTFPLIHMGRLWVGYWVMPIPNQFGSLWGELQLTTPMGRFRHFYLSFCIARFLVHRTHS